MVLISLNSWMLRRYFKVVIAFFSIIAAPSWSESSQWWSPGSGETMQAANNYPNQWGMVGVINAEGQLETRGHPFFEPLGTNGRACVSCHQPANAMSLSVDAIREQWRVSDGKDPIFAAIDGSNCPHLPQGEEASHSLLLNRGLFRIGLPWPPKRPDGTEIQPEFSIEVVRDPTGCNTHPSYGLTSASPTVSVYRRPRMVANMRYVLSTNFGVTPFIVKTGEVTDRDPETGKFVNMNIMADARTTTLRSQAIDAALTHLEVTDMPDVETLQKIVEFEEQVYVAQSLSFGAGSLTEKDGPSGLGPINMMHGKAGFLGNNTTFYIIPMDGKWENIPRQGSAGDDSQADFRESVARGQKVFMFRTFWISDSMHINTVNLGNPIKRTCATCHGQHMTGMDSVNGWMDIGSTNLPWAMEPPISPWAEGKPEMPLFKLTCDKALNPHPFLGRVIYTQDPGRALISGKCDDIGTIVMQQFRGLSARSPYFSNGSAQSLRQVVDFYDRRYNIKYTEQEKTDLVNFLSTL